MRPLRPKDVGVSDKRASTKAMLVLCRGS